MKPLAKGDTAGFSKPQINFRLSTDDINKPNVVFQDGGIQRLPCCYYLMKGLDIAKTVRINHVG